MKTSENKRTDGTLSAGSADDNRLANETKTDEGWERPVAVAKDRNVRAWFIFLGVICFAVALWTPVRMFYYRHGYVRAASDVKRDSDTFVAIAYYGINDEVSHGSQDIPTKVFAEELRLLRENGYTPIGLQDVLAFYKEGKLLPRKAVLMTFEQSRKSSYFEIRTMLRAYKWKAVMGVTTAPMHVKDAQALLWPYLRDMLIMGYWDLAAESEQGFSFIETSPDGHTGDFFANPQWLKDAKRYELPEEFNKRVENDHDSVIREFQRETGTKPVAFFFPYGDYGQYEEQARVVRMANMHQVGAHYGLGFILGQLALNTRGSDPRRLNRLLVDPSWTPQQFIDKLENFWPLKPAYGSANRECGADHWIGEWGDVFTQENDLVLRAVPPVNPVMTLRQKPSSGTGGAKAWLAGSDTFLDGFLALRFHLKRGRFGVYLRSTSVGTYVYFSLDEAGKVSVRQRLQDVDERVLATDTLSGEGASNNHELLICLRDSLFFARLDGQTLFGGRVMLSGEEKPGLLAVGVWDPIPGIAEASVLGTRLVGRRDALATWTPDVAKDITYLTGWLNEYGYQFNVIAPPWLDIYENAPITFPLWDQKALTLLARTNKMRIMPHVQVRDATLLQKVPVNDIVARAIKLGISGLYLDTKLCSSDQVTVLVTWLVKLNEALQAKHLTLILKLPDAIESLPSAANVLHLLPGVILAGDFQAPPFNLKDDQVLGITQVLPASGDETLSLYYQLSNLQSVYNDVSPDAKKEELRETGFDAFTVGDYPEAIRLWTQWSKQDPRNAEALSLIGDAWMRLNEPEKALDAYTQSLSINPGQMNLAIRHSRLLEQLNRLDESADLLNVYARAFPDTPAITIAQAQWLNRHRQHKEAGVLMKALVQQHPDNIEARLILQTLLDNSADRYNNMRELLSIGRSSESHLFGFGRDIFAAELLTVPEASVFFDFVRQTAGKDANKKTVELYQSFLPLTENVVENFITDKLSDHWVAFGGFRPSAYGRYELRAGVDMSEAFLRLKQSELLRDAFLEVTLDESAGSFWLYARRSAKSMIRYGYDDEGYIRIQSWYNGDLRTYDSRPWLRPPGAVQLRLEVRGDGAAGYVNGKPEFTTPLSIPSDVCYGWWSIAPFSPELGVARARIARIACGPLAPTILLMPRQDNADACAALDIARLHVRDFSAVAPFAFTQLSDGTIPADPEIELTPFKMFCTFHRLRLMPVVDSAYFSNTMPEQLEKLILKNHLAGLILRVRTMPDEDWFRQMEKMIERTTADVIVLGQEAAYWRQHAGGAQNNAPEASREAARLNGLPEAEVREIQRGNLLLPPLKDRWQVRVQPYVDWLKGLATGSGREGMAPCLVVMPRDFLSLPSVFETPAAPAKPAQVTLPAEPQTPPPETPAAKPAPAPAAQAGVSVTDDKKSAASPSLAAAPVPAAPAVPDPVTVVSAAATGKVTRAVSPEKPSTNAPPQSLLQRLRVKLGGQETPAGEEDAGQSN